MGGGKGRKGGDRPKPDRLQNAEVAGRDVPFELVGKIAGAGAMAETSDV